ncbi:lipase family protein [Corynebacteriales bacterium D3-21]|uniref:Lipase family protein n=1 Tax=Speluncibacter jeojiensis TaxID=2710754 RepID=A0A9X4M4W7_9ACTN|nr:lipase family protein [Corynebacteriales bacterium D3-21]
MATPAAAADAAAPGAPGADVPNQPPALGQVFNGFVVGAFQDGRMATRSEFSRGLDANDPFYAEPKLTGAEKPGTLLKWERVDVQFTGFRPGNVDAYKLMYVTTGLHGDKQISTGILMIPRDGRDNADRTLVGYQMANDAVGGYCHPSTMWTGGDPADGASWSALGPLALMFGKGMAVMSTDIGNDGSLAPHSPFAGKFAGHANLDGLRAALALPPAGLNKHAPIGEFGIAGGGVGAAFAAEQAAEYAPELNIKATVLEGMVVDERNFMRVANGSVGSGFAFATLLGLEPSYPEMKLDEKLSPLGRTVADYYRTQCQTPAYFTLPYVPLGALFKGGQNPADIPDFQAVYDDNLLGTRAPKSKVLVASCAADDSPMSLVPAADSRNLVAQYRAGGTDVSYQPTDCSMTRMLTNLYGWGTDLFGMQTVEWLDANTRG